MPVFQACFNVAFLYKTMEPETDIKPLNGCHTLAQLCVAPGDKTVVSFAPVNSDNVSLTCIVDLMSRKGRVFFIEAGEERRPCPDGTWLSVEVVGERLDGNGVAVAWHDGVIHFNQRLTEEDQNFLSDEDWSLNFIVCHGKNEGDNFIVDVVTNIVYESSLDDLLDTMTSMELHCALDDLPKHRATYDWQLFENLVSGRTTKKRSMLLWMRCGSSNHFFRDIDSSDRRFALDVFAYQKVGNRTRFFSGPVQFSAHNDRLTRAGPEIEFANNGGSLISFDLLLLPGKSWTDAKVDNRWEFNAVMKKKDVPAESPYATGNDRKEIVEEELEKARKSRRDQKRPKILRTEPNGLDLLQSFGSNERPLEAVAQISVNGLVSYRAMSDEVIVSPRRYLSQHDVMSKLMTKAADIAGFCREDDIRELFLHGLEAKQNLRWLYMHIGQIAKMSGPRQVSALNASVRRVMYAMNNNTIGVLLFRLFLAPIVVEVTGTQMMVESIGANWLKKANLLKNSLELAEHVKHVDLFQNQSTSDNWDLSTIYEPFVEVWPDSQPYFDLFTCCLNMCVDLFAHELH